MCSDVREDLDPQSNWLQVRRETLQAHCERRLHRAPKYLPSLRPSRALEYLRQGREPMNLGPRY